MGAFLFHANFFQKRRGLRLATQIPYITQTLWQNRLETMTLYYLQFTLPKMPKILQYLFVKPFQNLLFFSLFRDSGETGIGTTRIGGNKFAFVRFHDVKKLNIHDK